MWRRPLVTLLILVIPMILALPLRAQQKPVAQGPWFGPAAFPSTCVATALPAEARQEDVGPSGAGPRPNAVRPYVACAAAMSALPPRAQQKPFTQEQVSNMVRDGFGDESGAKLIEQRGIDFAPSEDFYQTLKAAGASEAFLNALRAAKPPEPASAKKPINQVQVFALLVGQVPSHRVTLLVQERGIDFEPTDDYLQEVRLAGGEDELISALKGAKVTKPVTVDPAAQARQAQVQQHVARGAELKYKMHYTEAEQEYRAAILLDSQNPDLYGSLAYVLGRQNKWDDAESALREALNLNPDDDSAHFNLGVVLENEGNRDAEIMEYREALRLNPKNDLAHANLGLALEGKGDWDGAIAEERAALRLDPNNTLAHGCLGSALENKGNLDGAIAEFREALRLNPNDVESHVNLGGALGERGDWDGDITEQRTALRLNSMDAIAHYDLGLALEQKGDWVGGISEEREALRLDPKNSLAHIALGFAFGQIGDWDKDIDEEREALRLDPKNADAHFNLCTALNTKGDTHAAREECHAAYSLSPDNAAFKSAYESILKAGESERANASLEELPSIELAKLEGTCRWETSGQLMCDIYNGSSWNVFEVTVQITVKEHDKEKGDTVVLSRRYRLSKYITLQDSFHGEIGKYLESLKYSKFFVDLGLSLSESQRWKWSFVSATGHPLSVR